MKAGILFAIIIALFIGGVVAFGDADADRNRASTTEPGIGGGPEVTHRMDEQDLLTLNNLLREHGNLAVLHLQAIYDDKDTSATQNLIETNNQEILDFFDQRVDLTNRNELEQMWQEHIALYVAYTQALKNDDQEAMEDARQNLERLAGEMGQHFNQINNNYEAQRITSLMNEHVRLTLSVIDAHAEDNYPEQVNNIKDALDQATQFAEYLVENLNE